MLRLLLSGLLALPLAAQPSVVVEEAFPGVRFAQPVGVETVQVPGEGPRYFVIEQGRNGQAPARILTLRDGDTAPTVFLDITDRSTSDGEAGLLGLAFHPDYATNGRFFVRYSAPVSSPEPGVRVLESRLSEFARSATDPLSADPDSEQIVLTVDQPDYNHNGGTVDFGPDGLLYIGFGDGGGGGDPYDQGQDTTTLLGAMLRIDIDDVPEGETYGIPDDNPFAATDGPDRDEIFAWGLRNPFKFDVSASGVWVADVGQDKWEEVALVENGQNHGWPEVEGPECYRSGCDLSAYTAPVLWYGHNALGGFSITGGYPVQILDSSLDNHYLYGDFLSGRVWAYDIANGGEPTLLFDRVPTSSGMRAINVSSIDQGDGLPLVTDYGGTIYRLLPGGTNAASGPTADGLAVSLAGPNPFRTATALTIDADASVHGDVRVVLLDALGRQVAQLWDGPVPMAPLAIDGTGLPSGVYTALVSGGDRRASLRLVLAR